MFTHRAEVGESEEFDVLGAATYDNAEAGLSPDDLTPEVCSQLPLNASTCHTGYIHELSPPPTGSAKVHQRRRGS